MLRVLFAFLFGLVTGVAAIHVLEGPLDFQVLREEAGEALDEASRGARDMRMSASVRAALALQKDFGLFGGISVKADAETGQVTLSGRVGSDDQRTLAELIARGVDGVEEVTNELEVVSGG